MEAWFKQSWSDLKGILLKPKDFFDGALSPQAMSLGVGRVLIFALLCHWIGAAFSFFFGTVANEILADAMSKLFPNARQGHDLVMSLLFGGVFVVLDPFFNLFRLVFGTLVMQVSSMMFLPKTLPDGLPARSVDFEKLFRMACYSDATSLFRVVPLVGDMAAMLYRSYILAVALHRASGHSLGRALWVVVFPYVLLFFLAVSFIVLLIALAIGVAVH